MAIVGGAGGSSKREDKGLIGNALNSMKTNTSSSSSAGAPNRYTNPTPTVKSTEGPIFQQTKAIDARNAVPEPSYVPSSSGNSGSYSINPNGMSDEWLQSYYDQLLGILGNQRDAAMKSWDTWAEQQRSLAQDETERLRNRNNRSYLLTNKMLRNTYGDNRSGQGATNTMAAYQNWKSSNEGLGQKLLDTLMNINAQAQSGKANAETQMAQNYNNYLLPVVQGLTQARYNR